MKLKNNQSGFGAIESLLLLIIVGMIAFVGWYVWHASQNVNNGLTANSTTSNVQPTVIPLANSGTTPSGWTQYKDSQYGFSFAYPNGWIIDPLTFAEGKNSNGMIYDVAAVDPAANESGAAPYAISVLNTSLAKAIADEKGLNDPPQAVKTTWKGTQQSVKAGHYQGVKLTTTYRQTDPASNNRTAVYFFEVKGKIYRTSYITELATLNPSSAKNSQLFLDSIKLQ